MTQPPYPQGDWQQNQWQPPQQGGWYMPGSMPPPPPHRSRRPLIITLCVIGVIVLVGGIITGIVLTNQPGGTGASPTSSVKVDSNTLILKQSPATGAPLTYGAIQAFDACTVFKYSDITDLGLTPKIDVKLIHSSVDSGVPADKAIAQDTSYEISSCVYPLNVKNTWVNLNIDIDQAPFNDQIAIDLDRSVPQGTESHSVSGITWYHADKGSSSDKSTYNEYFFSPTQNSFLVTVGFNVAGANGSIADLLGDSVTKVGNRIAENLAKGPQAPVQFAYTGPATNVPLACDLVTADITEKINGFHDWRWKQGIDYQAATESPLVKSSCMRLSNGSNKYNPAALYFDFSTYQNASDAEQGFQEDACKEGPATTINTAIGDTSKPCVTDNELGAPLSFRVGRVVASLTLADEHDPAKAAQTLMASAQALVAKLKY